jgi:phage portal protein BeeE
VFAVVADDVISILAKPTARATNCVFSVEARIRVSAYGDGPATSKFRQRHLFYGSAVQAAQDLVTNALAPLAQRVEQAMARCLLSTEGRRTLIIEHDLSGLLRGDATARWAAHKTAREIGAISSREIRRIENLGPMDPNDDYAPLSTSPTPSEPIASAT